MTIYQIVAYFPNTKESIALSFKYELSEAKNMILKIEDLQDTYIDAIFTFITIKI